MRILVFTTECDWSMRVRLPLMIGARLAERDAEVTFVIAQGSEASLHGVAAFPQVPVRTVSGSAVTRISQLRTIVKSTRANAILVHTERDALTAALAIRRRGGVVRRLSVGERFVPSWRARLAGARTNQLLIGDETSSRAHVNAAVRVAVAWPDPSNGRPLAAPDGSPPRFGQSPTIAIVAGESGDGQQHAAGAAAMRAAARVVSRHPDLRVLLIGETASLQALRVHAGAVGIAERLTLLPLDALTGNEEFSASTVWVTSQGDDGAVAVVCAMKRRIPVIVPRGFDTEALVASRITGFVVDDGDLAGSVASLAHLLSDAEERRAMGAAAAARAERVHGWEALVTRTMAALARVGG